MREIKTFQISDVETFCKQLLQWSQAYDEILYLNSNSVPSRYSSYDAILAVDGLTSLRTDAFQAFEDLEEYYKTTNDWIFGYLSYDLKNAIERLSSKNHDGLDFAELHFFQPKKIWLLKGNNIEAQYLPMVDDELDGDFKAISETVLIDEIPVSNLNIQLRTSKDNYFNKIDQLLKHIHRGDIYEANFCQEFFAEGIINPLQTFKKLNQLSKPPFATYMKIFDQYLMSASPERYLKKTGPKVISQPIKGTSKRADEASEDKLLRQRLENDPKERSENVMIVDLVRNDLSKTAKKGSVTVEELCKAYTFEQVHQLISTVSSEVDNTVSPIDILNTTFPMGSMTGAPKISAMKIIEELEGSKRGLYSGAVGYLTPDGDFDFNVVIRSILYNASKPYISFSVGGAITAKSIPENEYEECLIKAKAMRDALLNG